MAPLPKLLLPLLSLAMALMAMSTAAEAVPGEALVARLQADGMAQCWDSLLELRACTGEVILFFLNGQTYLGPSCCRAIRVIEHRCWAADVMLTALGFTAEEGDVLRGYCNDESDSSTPPPAPLVAHGPPSEETADVAGGDSVALKGLLH